MPILNADPNDIPALVQLVNEAYRGGASGGGWTNESHLLEGPRTHEADIAALLNDPDASILKNVDAEGTLSGCVYLQRQGNLLYLGMLSVSPGQQDAGIGKQLLFAAEAYAREKECDRIQMTVISLRTELVAWYERHGFLRTGERLPFHAGEKFGIQRVPLELVVLEKSLANR